MDRLSTADLNAMEKDGFVASLGAIYEHSEWVAWKVAEQRPFQDRAAIASAMRMAVETGTDEEKLALIRAHPDLAGKLARAGQLSESSTREQAGLGLDRLSDEEYERFSNLNDRYRERFGFPFVICVRMADRSGILSAFEQRLGNQVNAEISEALRQIHQIAKLRLADLIGE
ncbi:2-oxo-4-hydroxy-4-carboxy-5-ureidoimidazoline decarboxylase [Luteolibacter luteus]|uniref:2-oxo-4-hydroxy-4-carboxy-5-ureidoimidazoline decarboxylase n=1 Tax=Luteolibacter luteus TaxID=2728835 RepID=A0A858RI13_9BACT|nr:2-oxo-4-hydroxy-4-carboxy-5-ureidoimidazoline decarboxylase [Luteolibacter luteus]QJE96059.1 2-oxo-4-hydroxy-4-carboxy-5-ureidoimidazoline decarboxylase [Luteolibacter luteus]